MKQCPCHSQRPYETCCRRYHEGEAAPTAELLMRSRYAAYALGLTDYIIATTHPNFRKGLSHESINAFSESTKFVGLTIESHSEEGSRAIVTFLAKLTQGGTDASFRETSRFEKVAGRWLYQEGVVGM